MGYQTIPSPLPSTHAPPRFLCLAAPLLSEYLTRLDCDCRWWPCSWSLPCLCSWHSGKASRRIPSPHPLNGTEAATAPTTSARSLTALSHPQSPGSPPPHTWVMPARQVDAPAPFTAHRIELDCCKDALIAAPDFKWLYTQFNIATAWP